MVLGRAHQPRHAWHLKDDRQRRTSRATTWSLCTTRKDNKGDQPIGGETPGQILEGHDLALQGRL